MILFEKRGNYNIMKKRNLFIITPFFILLVVFYIKYREVPYQDYQNFTLTEMHKFDDKLEKITASYSSAKNIDEKYEQTLYDCVGSLVYTKDANLKFSTILDECNEDYQSKSNKVYFNQSWLMQGFNPWNGSYGPLQKIIQKTIKEPKSYEMLKTTYEMNFTDKRPHMFVSVDFKGANIQGYMLNRNISAKVDAKTKEIYDIK